MDNTLFLTAAALFPAIVLCIYVYRKDRVEKEPLSLLLKLLLLGAACCLPAACVESALTCVMESVVYNFYAYNFFENFFCVALVEEGFKLLVLIYVTRKNEDFNSLFDGLIYAIFVSLGFAALENILYVLQNGFGNAVMRAILSVPGHMFFAVMMGYYYSLWHINDKARNVESYYKTVGVINPYGSAFESKKYRYLCIVVPTMAHGFYNFCCSVPEWWATVLLYGFVVLMYIKCFRKINEMSYMDEYSGSVVQKVVIKEYPVLAEHILN